jgi:trypsin
MLGALFMRGSRFSILLISLVFGTIGSVVGQEEIKPFGRRIVGGEPTTIEKHPWQVAVNVIIDGQTYLCGGSIVADRWVLTAAHCFRPTTKASEVRVKTGVTKYMTEGAWLDIERVVVHEAYNPDTNENDLALLSGEVQGRRFAAILRAPSVTN